MVRIDGRPLDDRLDPFALLDRILAAATSLDGSIRGLGPDLPPFRGGIAGLLGYGLVRHLERIPTSAEPRTAAPDMAVGLYDAVMAFDHQARRRWWIEVPWTRTLDGLLGIASDHRMAGGPGRVPTLARLGMDVGKRSISPAPLEPPFQPDERPVWRDMDRPAYERAVASVIEHIHAGDIYQANLSQRLRVPLAPGDEPFDVYRRLRVVRPAPFAAFLRTSTGAVVSSSPERFLSIRDGIVETRPIKGTRPRGDTPAQDRRLAEELVRSEKDRAENVMIVDLMRNDLSRVCADGSVTADVVCGLETFAGVHHLVSRIGGRLREDLTPVDALRASFPGGSITGAPRVRAMEIIASHEPVDRGPYCGSLCWMGIDGQMDSSIAIRTMWIADGIAHAHAGGGIVADSDPAHEYDETLVKATGMIQAAAGLDLPSGPEGARELERRLTAGPTSAANGDTRRTVMPTPTSTNDPRPRPRPMSRNHIPEHARGDLRGGARRVPTVLIIDSYDSFVDNLARYVGELGWHRRVVRHDRLSVDDVIAMRPDHIVLSPGPGTPDDAGIGPEIVRRLGGRIPILGVCLGHQVIARALGGEVIRADRPVHGRTSLVRHDRKGIFEGLPETFNVARYHSLVVSEDSLPDELVVTARTMEGTIMGLRHRHLALAGVQFHPEAVLSEHGHRMLANALGMPGDATVSHLD